MEETARARGQRLARESLAQGDPTGWFETLYASAHGDAHAIQWADMAANPNLVAWLEGARLRGDGKRALVIGCGLGDDAEELARAGFAVVAFDISPTAIAWCHERFPDSPVRYVVADLFASPCDWQGMFDLVLEAYTLQVLPADSRPPAIEHIASYVAPGGRLLVICRGRDVGDDPGRMPWPLTRGELELFRAHGLRELRFEDYIEHEASPTRRFRVEYQKVSSGE
ncbi:MAG TPA: class I SAM-dependent methyltransferase [Chloroflexota bacterium]|nr:class I SAM-dependent methyltransferase [Chloroflexota bacterium]